MVHPLAGQPVKREDIINVDMIVKDFFRIVPSYSHIEERVTFGLLDIVVLPLRRPLMNCM